MRSVNKIILNSIFGVIFATAFVLGLSTIDSEQNIESNIQAAAPIENSLPRFGEDIERSPQMEIALSEDQDMVKDDKALFTSANFMNTGATFV
ncbi:hypothetical protein ACFL96_18320, partial [Thermoproteota archaeon]